MSVTLGKKNAQQLTTTDKYVLVVLLLLFVLLYLQKFISIYMYFTKHTNA